MHSPFKRTHLAEILLESKHLVVVLGILQGYLDAAGVANLIKGAGVSKAAGIPTFRGSDGLYSPQSKAGSLVDLFNKDTFQNADKCSAHAMQMAKLAKLAAGAQPTSFHILLKALLRSGILGRVYTQNIDDLELKAGLTTIGDEPQCMQLHGSVMQVQCTQCSFTEHIQHHFSTLSLGMLPACPKCRCWIERRKSEGKRIASRGGLLRPAIILYGESHPTYERIATMQALDSSRADNLLVVGTSLKTFGSVCLIRDIAAALRERGHGKVYYMDVEAPSTSQLKVFDHFLQADCQEFANYMLEQLENQEDMRPVDHLPNTRLADLVRAGRVREDMRPSWDWV